MLNVLEACVPKWAPGQTLASLGPASAKYWHFLFDAKKLAYADLFTYNADPNFSKGPLQSLLSKSYAVGLCAKVDPASASRTGPISVVDNGAVDIIVLSVGGSNGDVGYCVNS